MLLAAGSVLLAFMLAPKVTGVSSSDPWPSADPPDFRTDGEYLSGFHYLCGPEPKSPESHRADPKEPPPTFHCDEGEIPIAVSCTEDNPFIRRRVRNPRVAGHCFGCVVFFGSRPWSPKLIEGDERLRLPLDVVSEKVQGLVLVQCTLTETGIFTQCEFRKTLPWVEHGIRMNLAARRYEPALFAGKPQSVRYMLQFRFPHEPCVLEGPLDDGPSNQHR